nr:membrane protein insertion efficiency factor YidD [Leptospira gomenensis]
MKATSNRNSLPKKRLKPPIKTGISYILLFLFSYCRTAEEQTRSEDLFFLNRLILSKIEAHQTVERNFQNVACPMEPSCSQFVKEQFEQRDFISALLFSLNRILFVENRFLHGEKNHRIVYVKNRGKLIEDRVVDQLPRDYSSLKREFRVDSR